ncbi:PspC domain-containing protein [Flavobacterium sp.]|uniref:PspC domain-containing protein n=1 Tax=Flavobacterium sp. TaxID=239 RepID=UPI00262A3031|nr:PspC domain-containing protein [Flavobacterium sp.]MDD3004797.1 PspC domain-containing protein [Flavobacterium sp.]
MNKTVNINLGGMFFHIDEDAYQKLSRYFEAIKRSLTNSNGQDEIIKDIEMRIAELFAEKNSNGRQVISLRELDEVIAVMGQPEDYRIDSDENEEPKFNYNTQRKTVKKLYRDREGGMIGGVLAGLGHYFGIDKVWIRVFFLILILFYGVGLIPYIILWIVMPEAVTTAEKLEMSGEPVNISNIEKKVREEFENVSERLKNVNYDEMGNQVKTGADKIASNAGKFFMTLFNIFAKILGVLLIISALPVLVMLLIGIFTLGTSAFVEFPWSDFIQAGNFSDFPVWTFGLLVFFAVGIPFFYLMILGFKLLITNMKSLGNIVNYTLFALWVISLILLITIALNQMMEYSTQGRVVHKQILTMNTQDTLQIKFTHNDYFAKSVQDKTDFNITQDSASQNVIYSNNVRLTLVKTEESMPYLQIEKKAKGRDLSVAKQKAEQIKYGFKFENNQLILDNYILTDVKNKFRDQEVELILYLPKGTLFKVDNSVENYDRSDDDFFNLYENNENALYQVENSQVKCLNCYNSEFDEDMTEETIITADSTRNIVIKVNGKEQKATELINTKKTSLTIDKNGIIIKKE